MVQRFSQTLTWLRNIGKCHWLSGLYQIPPMLDITSTSAFHLLYETLREISSDSWKVLSMNNAFFVLMFLDDVFAFSKNVEEQKNICAPIFKRFDVPISNSKNRKFCLFKESVTYLGYKMHPEGLPPDDIKLILVREWKRPKNVSEVSHFFYSSVTTDISSKILLG